MTTPSSRPPTKPAVSRIVDSAVYLDGVRVASPRSLAETYAALHRQPDGMAWIGLYRPEQHEVASLASEFQLHELAVEDAIVAHQRPKLERYDDILFVVLRPARTSTRPKRSSSARCTSSSVPTSCSRSATARHRISAPFAAGWRAKRELLRRGPEAVLYAILDRVVDGYYPVVAGAGQRHRRDRDRGVQRGSPRVAAHL